MNDVIVLFDEQGTPTFRSDRERDIFIIKHPKSMLAECSRAIRTNLRCSSVPGRLGSVSTSYWDIGVSSNSGHSAKSSVSVSLMSGRYSFLGES